MLAREANMRRTNSGLEVGNFLIGHRISFGDHGNEVNACMQTGHELNINGSETYGRSVCMKVINEVEAHEWPVG